VDVDADAVAQAAVEAAHHGAAVGDAGAHGQH
jgi:hypothetical protein